MINQQEQDEGFDKRSSNHNNNDILLITLTPPEPALTPTTTLHHHHFRERDLTTQTALSMASTSSSASTGIPTPLDKDQDSELGISGQRTCSFSTSNQSHSMIQSIDLDRRASSSAVTLLPSSSPSSEHHQRLRGEEEGGKKISNEMPTNNDTNTSYPNNNITKNNTAATAKLPQHQSPLVRKLTRNGKWKLHHVIIIVAAIPIMIAATIIGVVVGVKKQQHSWLGSGSNSNVNGSSGGSGGSSSGTIPSPHTSLPTITGTPTNGPPVLVPTGTAAPPIPSASATNFAAPPDLPKYQGLATTYSQSSNIGAYRLAAGEGSGVAAIHLALMVNTGKVVMTERWDIHGTKAVLANGSTAFSVEYDYNVDVFRPLTLQTNLFCAGGMLLPDGRLMVIGGAENGSDPTVGYLADGQRAVRLISPSGSESPTAFGTADWIDPQNPTGLQEKRWYPTMVTLPDGRVLVVGGSNIGVEFNIDYTNTASLEILPSGGVPPVPLQFLWDSLPANLYPVTTVLPSGRVFVFAGDRSTLLDPANGYDTLKVFQGMVGVPSSKIVSPGTWPNPMPFTCLAETVTGVSGGLGYLSTAAECNVLNPARHNDTASPEDAQAFVLFSINTTTSYIGRVIGTQSGLCWSASSGSNNVNLAYCSKTDEGQIFSLNADSSISHVQTGLCLSNNGQIVVLDKCSSGSQAQTFGIPPNTWYFEFPRLGPGPFRSYPWTGFGILLPLDPYDDYEPSVMICGGSQLACGWNCLDYECQKNCQSTDALALDSCGVLYPDRPWAASTTSASTTGQVNLGPGLTPWDLSDVMPTPRVLGDLVHLPDGSILLLNGAGSGMAGWDLGRNPVLQAMVFLPRNPPGKRWFPLDSSTIPRMYHSTAMLLPDGRVIVAGSAPNSPTDLFEDPPPQFQNEHRVEYFHPPYLTVASGVKPGIQAASSVYWDNYDDAFTLRVNFTAIGGDGSNTPSSCKSPLEFNIIQTGFRTHSTGHGQRMIWLVAESLGDGSNQDYVIFSPPTPEIAPPGWYLLHVVCEGVPSNGVFVQIGGDPASFASFSPSSL